MFISYFELWLLMTTVSLCTFLLDRTYYNRKIEDLKKPQNDESNTKTD